MRGTFGRLGLVALCALAANPQARAQDCAGWTQLHPAKSMGEASNQAMVFDSARARAVFYRGSITERQTWEWDGSNWLMAAGEEDPDTPESSRWHAMAYDSARAVTVLFGGRDQNGTSQGTSEWTGKEWVTPSVDPPFPLERHAMAYDSGRGVTVMFGGDSDFNGLVDYTWEYDGTAWTSVQPPQRPSARLGHVMAYDQDRGVVVLFGGADDANVLNDTWEYDGSTWVQRMIPGPGKRLGAAMVYDPDRKVCVLFGGGGGDYRDDTWEYDGKVWTQITTLVRPQARAAHAMAYDTARREILLYGGVSPGQVLSDTWVFRCTAPCYPDLNGDGALDLFDFLAYITLFNAGDPTADCDASGSLDLFDFLCFVNAFNAGC